MSDATQQWVKDWSDKFSQGATAEILKEFVGHTVTTKATVIGPDGVTEEERGFQGQIVGFGVLTIFDGETKAIQGSLLTEEGMSCAILEGMEIVVND